MFQSTLLIGFWGVVVLTTTNIINRTRTSLLPFKVLYNKAPSYSHRRVFGCLCFTSTISQNRKKFDHRVKKFIFIGCPIAIKWYKLFDLNAHTMFISRDMVFHELSSHLRITTKLTS